MIEVSTGHVYNNNRRVVPMRTCEKSIERCIICGTIKIGIESEKWMLVHGGNKKRSEFIVNYKTPNINVRCDPR